MPNSSHDTPLTEVGHILLIDLAPRQQASAHSSAADRRQLQQLVSNAREFLRARANRQLLYEDVGGAVALVFFGDPEAPARCAVELGRTGRGRPPFTLRMGLHSGPVQRVTRADGQEGVVGNSLEVARRVTECGDAGHILLTVSAAEALNAVANWRKYLHPLGSVEVEHGVWVPLLSLHTGEAGNEQVPAKLRPAMDTTERGPVPGEHVGDNLNQETLPASASTAETVLDARGDAPDSAAPYKLKVRQQFHGLLVHTMLGEGAMGAAYLASHPVLRMPLVIKTFKHLNTSNIFKEAHLAARVTSPNVVGVLDAGVAGNTPFLVQRYVDGVDLAELLKHFRAANWRLPVNMVCRIVIDAARGLHAIHQAGVIHRDVKPANLFLQGNGVATVGDFGVAVEALRDRDAATISGTPFFMAPEQWRQQEVARATDVYALGATAHMLMTGDPPFMGQSIDEVRVAHLKQPYVPPPADTPGEAYMYSVIGRALRKAPEERYQTAEEMARELKIVTTAMPQYVSTGEGEAHVGSLGVHLTGGDIAGAAADVIVNAANQWLVMDVGVAAAQRQAAGEAVEQEAAAQGPVAMGDVVWTGAGNLRARWLAHAVAALGGAVCLQRCTLRVLQGAEKRQAGSLVVPALGTGVGGVPMDLGAKLVLESVRTFAAFSPRRVRAIRIVLRNEGALSRWREMLRSM